MSILVHMWVYLSSSVTVNSDSEIIWASVSLHSKDMFIGSFYRPPNVTHADTI